MAPTVHVVPSDASLKTMPAKKKTCAKASAKSNNKHKNGKPKRPLSAYNLFFQHERDRILRSLRSPYGFSHDDAHCTLGTDPSERTTNKPKKVRPPPHGKIGFAELAKMIGGRWKALGEEERSYYAGLADKEKERYDRDLRTWQLKKASISLGLDANVPSVVVPVPSSRPQSASWPQLQQGFSEAVAARTRPEQVHSSGGGFYMTAATSHTEQSAPRVVSADFGPSTQSSPSFAHMYGNQFRPQGMAPTLMPVANTSSGNGTWPVVSRVPEQETTSALDADIKKMLDLLMSSDAFDL